MRDYNFIKNFLKRNQDKLTLLINFWVLTFFYIFTGLIIMENLEMGTLANSSSRDLVDGNGAKRIVDLCMHGLSGKIEDN